MTAPLPKIVVILGPTASGKTDLGIALAKEFSAKGGPASGGNGEIINADSRQVYKEMNIATAKPSKDAICKRGEYCVGGVPHHLIDIVSPNQEFSLADFKIKAEKAITDIVARGKLPIIVGGTGLYIWALTDNLNIPKIAPNKKLRAGLGKKPLAELVKLLRNIDPASAAKVDLKNPRRVLRALEVAISSGDSFVAQTTKSQPKYITLLVGLNWPRAELVERINKRVDMQIARGLVEETKKLSQKYSWTLPSMSGIGYKQLRPYLEGKSSLAEAVERIKIDTRQYSKRQMTWFKRDKKIKWIEKNNIKEAKELVKGFIN